MFNGMFFGIVSLAILIFAAFFGYVAFLVKRSKDE
ncbi:hypothetical protein EDD68_11416 [Melghiribacillus thermohalophilus]|uniref:Uncharacterized protein n=1 Tax=Melghiribacillus thermohalophilus TaxID=1324956 RepID=A0A4R3MVH8_9BACI|nr:hypothetical protein EDD68_11416 [Melghiribacillus thermohalophilus]